MGLLTWTDLPPGSPAHHDDPYAFKIFAFLEAVRHEYTSVLWLDAPCRVVGALDPIFEQIEKEGHLFITGGERLGNWATDPCLTAFGLTRDDAMGLALLNGTLIGLDLSKDRSRRWLADLRVHFERGLFRGPWLSQHAPPEIRKKRPGRPVSLLSEDPRCWGHRHDEAVGSCLAHSLGMAINPQEGFFNTKNAPILSLRDLEEDDD